MHESTSVQKQAEWNWVKRIAFVSFVSGGSMAFSPGLRLVACLLVVASGALLLVNRFQDTSQGS